MAQPAAVLLLGSVPASAALDELVRAADWFVEVEAGRAEVSQLMDGRVTEFHYITPLENIPSVLEHGILSYERAEQRAHRSVAMAEVQEKRDAKQVPGGLKLHQYANLYFHARNPMMFKRRNEAPQLGVLRVSISVGGLDGVVFADRNAAGGDNWVRFLHPRQWAMLDFDLIYSPDWRDTDRFAYYEKKQKKCAEVLVPHGVTPNPDISHWGRLSR